MRWVGAGCVLSDTQGNRGPAQHGVEQLARGGALKDEEAGTETPTGFTHSAGSEPKLRGPRALTPQQPVWEPWGLTV